jgi:outer membrane protein with beta-barrel domain
MIITARRRPDVDPPRGRWARRALFAFAMAAVVSAAAPAHADWAIGAEGGYFTMSNAPKSAKAIFGGSSGGGTFGGFLHLGLGDSFFVEAHGRTFQRTGERVFVADPTGPVFRLGHPLTIRLVPVYGMVGFKFLHGSRWAPYVAVGAGVTQYREESNVAGLVETASKSKLGGHAALGVDFLTGPIRVGAEVMYSTVPNTIGESGVSKVYNEKDVGGVSVAARIAFGSSAP